MTDQEIIYKAIREVVNTDNPAEFAAHNSTCYTIAKYVCEELREKLNSLPAEQPSEELEEEIKRKYESDNALMMPIESFRKLILYFSNWQKEQMMKSAINGFMDCDDSNEWIKITDRFIVTPATAGKKVKFIIMEDKQ